MGHSNPFLISFLVVTLLFSSNFASMAQTLDENKSGSWLVISGSNKILERWSIPTVGILRHHEMFEQYEFAFIRTGVSYHVGRKSKLTAGIAYLNSKDYAEISKSASQFWIYEEYTLKMNSFSHRLRLETRWKKRQENLSINHRVRYRLLYTRSLYGKMYIKSFNELFLNINGPIFDQNRFYVGIGRTLTPSLKIDIGYLKNNFRHSDNDVVRMGLTFKTDFTKKEMAQHISTPGY